MTFKAEYIWIDGTQPTAKLRSKTKIIGGEPAGLEELPIWGFDGSSTNQAEGHSSDRVLKPVFTCPDPIRGGRNILVMCEVLLASNMKPHPTNTRAIAARAEKKYAEDDMWFGLEQEYTMLRADGTLEWDIPPGRWTILRFGHTPTGAEVKHSRPEGRGLECDKMSARAARVQFQNYVGRILEETMI